MILFKTGNLLDSDAAALVNTVNTDGIMGKGIALQFKNMFPNNYKQYLLACKANKVQIGELFVTVDESLYSGKKVIVNFPTKTSWRKPSEYLYIESGLKALRSWIEMEQVSSIAIPPLGAGNGGLDWPRVREMITHVLSDIETEIQVYEPTAAMQEVLNKERVKLTPARAMLLAVLFDLSRHGEFVSEFAAEKVAYFLQRFGATDAFNLQFKQNFYGPYSGKVRHVLYYLNGSYIKGYAAKDKKPFEEIGLIPDGESTVNSFLNRLENCEYKAIVEKTKLFLSGYYSSFGLELLSTVDFIMQQHKVTSLSEISNHLENWSDRKKTKFSNPRFVQLAVNNIQVHLFS